MKQRFIALVFLVGLMSAPMHAADSKLFGIAMAAGAAGSFAYNWWNGGGEQIPEGALDQDARDQLSALSLEACPLEPNQTLGHVLEDIKRRLFRLDGETDLCRNRTSNGNIVSKLRGDIEALQFAVFGDKERNQKSILDLFETNNNTFDEQIAELRKVVFGDEEQDIEPISARCAVTEKGLAQCRDALGLDGNDEDEMEADIEALKEGQADLVKRLTGYVEKKELNHKVEELTALLGKEQKERAAMAEGHMSEIAHLLARLALLEDVQKKSQDDDDSDSAEEVD